MSSADSHQRHFDGRWYATTLASDLARDGIGLELDDVAPAQDED